MSVFTNITKKSLSWVAPVNPNVPTETVYTTDQKPALSFTAPAVGNSFLLITNGFYLLIGDRYRLLLNNKRNSTNWTEIPKSR